MGGAPRTQPRFTTSPPSLTGLCLHWSLFLDLLPPQASPLPADLSQSDPSLDASSSRKPSSISKEPGSSCLGSNTPPPLTSCGNLDYGSLSVCAFISSAVKRGIQLPYCTCALWTDELWHVRHSAVSWHTAAPLLLFCVPSAGHSLLHPHPVNLSPWTSKFLDCREGLVSASCVSVAQHATFSTGGVQK